MSPSFYPNSLGSFTSTSVSTTAQEPEPYVYPDYSDLYPVAERLGMQHHMSLTWASWFPNGAPVPERPDYMAAYDLMELHGLPVESDLLACFIIGWNDARDRAQDKKEADEK